METFKNAAMPRLESEVQEALNDVQESLPISLIATARNEFKVCYPEEMFSETIKSNQGNYDYLPVMTSPNGAIIGVLNTVSFRDDELIPDTCVVAEKMETLKEEWLIGADASILAFVRDADQRPFRFLVSGHEISGLVTISDLQSLPVRASLFAMVTQLELSMSNIIRQQYSDCWLECLSKGRKEKIHEEIALARAQDTFVDELLYSQFGDKVTILSKKWPFTSSPPTKSLFKSNMKAIQKLRNSLAHANEFARTQDEARIVCECVRNIHQYLSLLETIGITSEV